MRPFLLFALTIPLFAQWDDRLDKNVPRGRDGKPNLNAPAPKAANGKPDLTGVWWNFSPRDENDLSGNPNEPPPNFVNLVTPKPPNEVPMLPKVMPLFGQRASGLGKDFPLNRCLPAGIPVTYLIPAPFKFIQTPELIVMLFEETNTFRQIFLDGRPLPKDPVPAWQGYSVGHWEGDTLVVESSGFNDKTWLDGVGHPRTEMHHLTERFRRTNVGHMQVQVTIDDPGAYEKPWGFTANVELVPAMDLIEKVCLENEKDRPHMVGR